MLTTTAFILGRTIKSPSQRAAEAAPPEYTVVTSSVSQRVLRETIQLRGTATFANGSDVVAQDLPDVGRLVVSEIGVEQGQAATSGELLVAVSERPAFLLEGNMHAYRDMTPGMNGSDVAQLQTALGSMGHAIWDSTGYFGASTEQAVRRFYESRGYEPLYAGDRDGLVEAQRVYDELQAAYESLDEALSTALETNPRDEEAIALAESELEHAGRSRDEAERALSKVRDATGAMIPLGEVLFIDELPVQVEAVPVSVNDIVVAGEVLVHLSQGNLGVSAEISASEAVRVDSGMPVFLSAQGEELEGAVAAVVWPEAEANLEQAVPYLYVKANIPPEWKDSEVSLTVVVSETDGEVLAVPNTAIYTSVDGSVAVLRQTEDGPIKVSVRIGAQGDGYIEIISEELMAGDVVVVGQR
jgi:hypothetical protein